MKPFAEPERELHRRLRQAKARPTIQQPHILFEEMADKPMWRTRQAAPAAPTPPVRKLDTSDNRELTFDEKVKNDLNQHMDNFLDICDLFKHQGTSDDAVRIRIFPFTLIEEA